jgi:hypothetical protein
MKYILLILLFCMPVILPAQIIVVDSTKWINKYVDHANIGNPACNHKWVYDDPYPKAEESEIMYRKGICSKCKRCKIQKLKVFTHVVYPMVTKFDSLLVLLNDSWLKTHKIVYMKKIKQLKAAGAIDSTNGN